MPGVRLRRGPRHARDGRRGRRRTAVRDRRRRAAGRRRRAGRPGRRRRRRADPPDAVDLVTLGATKLRATVGLLRLRARALGVAVLLHVVDLAVTSIRLAFADGPFDGSTRRTRACCSWSRTASSRNGRTRRRREFSPTGRWRRDRRCRAPRDSSRRCGGRRRATGGTAPPARRRSGK